MNLDQIDIIKISDKIYKLYQLVNNQRQHIILDFQLINSPFGLEKFQNVYYINWELDYDSRNILKKIDNEINGLILLSNDKYKSWSWITNIKEKKNFLPLFKTRVLQSKNKFLVESNISLFDINYKNKMNITIILDSIWFNEKTKTYGLLWLINKII
jgi:hypothetical protein